MKSQSALSFIKQSISKGLTVYLGNHFKTIVISPKTFAKWEASKHDLFKIDAEGNLRIARGKHYDIIVSPTYSFVSIKAAKK